MKYPISMTAAVLMVSTGLLLASVHTDFDKKADFGRYHTYSWIGVSASDSLWQNRIRDDVDSALMARGWKMVPSGGDAAVSAMGRLTERQSMQTFYTGYPGWGWRAPWWGGWPGSTVTEVIPERVGTLTVDVFDGQSRQLIFRGRASDTLSEHPGKNEKKLEDAVKEMFEHFPPKGE